MRKPFILPLCAFLLLLISTISCDKSAEDDGNLHKTVSEEIELDSTLSPVKSLVTDKISEIRLFTLHPAITAEQTQFPGLRNIADTFFLPEAKYEDFLKDLTPVDTLSRAKFSTPFVLQILSENRKMLQFYGAYQGDHIVSVDSGRQSGNWLQLQENIISTYFNIRLFNTSQPYQASYLADTQLVNGPQAVFFSPNNENLKAFMKLANEEDPVFNEMDNFQLYTIPAIRDSLMKEGVSSIKSAHRFFRFSGENEVEYLVDIWAKSSMHSMTKSDFGMILFDGVNEPEIVWGLDSF